MAKKAKIDKDAVVWCDRGWQPLWFGFCPTEKAFDREVKRLGWRGEKYPTADANVLHGRSPKGVEIALVTVGDVKGRTRNEIIGLIVHEATHVWQFVRGAMKETREPSPEFEAYSMQAITQELLQAYDRTRGL